CEIDDIAINSDLTPEMGPRRRESVAQVPPQSSFRFCRRGPHLLRELPLPRHDSTIADCPVRGSSRGDISSVPSSTPTPNPSPQGGGECASPGIFASENCDSGLR